MTISSKLFWFLGVLLGLVTFVGGIFLYLHQVEFNYCSDEIFLILIGFFVIVGSVLVYTRRSTPIVFDRQIGIYKKSGRSLGTKANYQHGIQESIALDRIHAIQLVSKIIVGEDDFPSYNCHEVNLVLKDGSRLGVVEHRKLSQSKEDARKLSTFLGVDVWANVIQEE